MRHESRRASSADVSSRGPGRVRKRRNRAWRRRREVVAFHSSTEERNESRKEVEQKQRRAACLRTSSEAIGARGESRERSDLRDLHDLEFCKMKRQREDDGVEESGLEEKPPCPTAEEGMVPPTETQGTQSRGKETEKLDRFGHVKKRYRKELQKTCQSLLRWQNKSQAALKALLRRPKNQIEAVRHRMPWKKADRECLRRALLHFGLGRWDAVMQSMTEGLKVMPHSQQDVMDATAAFCKACLPHLEGKEYAFMVQEALPTLVGAAAVPTAQEWHKAEALAVSWARRLRLLQELQDARRLLVDEHTCESAKEHLKNMAETSAPSWWWDHQADEALVHAVYEHGYGQYDAVKESKLFENLMNRIKEQCKREGKTPRDMEASGAVGANPEKNVMSRMGHADTCTCVVCMHRKRKVADAKAAEAAQTTAAPVEGDDQKCIDQEEEKTGGFQDSKPEGSEEDSDFTLEWPVPDTLTRRLKRVVDHMSKLAVRPTKTRGRRISGRPHAVAKAETWTKREKMDLVRALMAHGLQPNFDIKGSPPHWALLREQANLNKSTGAVKECYLELTALAEKALESGKGSQPKPPTHLPNCTCVICTQKRQKAARAREEGNEEPEPPSENKDQAEPESAQGGQEDGGEQEVEKRSGREGASGGPRALFTSITATRLKERLELVGIVSRALHFMPTAEEWEAALPSWRGQDLPSWWQVGVHDHALAQGVLKHGYGSWDAIFADRSLEFHDTLESLKQQQLQALQSVSTVEPSKDVPKSEGGDSSLQSVEVELPSSKLCQRRLKFLSKSLRKGLKKAIKRPQAVSRTPSRPPPKPKAPPSKARSKRSRTKYAKHTDIPRGADGRPLLPLTITDKLYLIALGHIVHDRPGFHNDRHIFPAGLITRREHYSFVNPATRTYYTSEILDQGGEGPIFRVIADDAPNDVIERDTASGAWVEVSLRCHKLRGSQRNKVTVSGTEMFGLSHPDIAALVLELPGVEKCEKFQRFLSFARTAEAGEEEPKLEDRVVVRGVKVEPTVAEDGEQETPSEDQEERQTGTVDSEETQEAD